MKWEIVGIFLIAGFCWAEIELPPVDVNKLDGVAAIKEKCEKKSPDSYEKVKSAVNETSSCLEGKIVPNTIKDELDEAKKTGSMDEVFAKYCNKRQEYKNCIMKTVNATKECLEESEKTALDTGIKVVEEIIDFACYNDGDRLAMFVAEGGIECVGSRTSNILNCVNTTLKLNVDPNQEFSLASLPNSVPTLGIDKKKCDDLAKIRTCVVTDLEDNCKDTTPANIVDALFKFINKSTCKKLKQKRSYNAWRVRRNIQWQERNIVNLTVINEKVAENCKRNGGPQAVNDFWVSLSLAQNCFGKKPIFVTPKDEYLDTLKNCSDVWVAKAESCLSEELKFYPSLFIETVESLTGFAYDHLNFKTLSPKSEIVDCLQRIKNVNIKKSIDSCMQFSAPTDCTTFAIPNKTEICRQWIKVNECFNNFIKKTCRRDLVVDRFLANLTAASEKPCKSALVNLSLE